MKILQADKNRSPYRLILIKLHSMRCSREMSWKVMSDTDKNFLNELVILVALGGEQRGCDFTSFKEN